MPTNRKPKTIRKRKTHGGFFNPVAKLEHEMKKKVADEVHKKIMNFKIL